MQARRLRYVAFALVKGEKREDMRRKPVFIALTVLLLAFPTVVAAGAITVITTSEESTEATLAEIMEELYGWDNLIRISPTSAVIQKIIFSKNIFAYQYTIAKPEDIFVLSGWAETIPNSM